MKFSILIPTVNNVEYLKICINSILKNSYFEHEIIVHSNNLSDTTSSFLKSQNIQELRTETNYGLCTALNQLASKAKYDYLLFIHDDMYICPNWDIVLTKEIDLLDHNNFYLSGIMIERTNGHINYNFGETFLDFDEQKLLDNYGSFPYYDIQGSDKNPSLVHKATWNKVNGMSEEFNPGDGSDPNFILKLWNINIRIFKGLSEFRVYHFGSLTTRKNKDISLNNGSRIFLNKWGITYKFFRKYYLKYHSKYQGPLSEPNRNIFFYFELLICKIKLFRNFLFN